ncbi:hypothetical protein [uncultured Roseibium sp.]|uniref:hypothetical protein n=1 Tax=uncultured Roseibium sp. TaxID=1936171 RepID=UPI0032165337
MKPGWLREQPEKDDGSRSDESAGGRRYKIYWILAGLVICANIASFSFRGEISTAYTALSGFLQTSWGSADDNPAQPTSNKPPYEALPLAYNAPARRPFSELYQALDLQPPYTVVTSNSFMVGNTPIRLAYIFGIGATDLCIDDSFAKFPCGLMGRASLQNRISNEPMSCIPVFYLAGAPHYDCHLTDGMTLSRFQVHAGFARPDSLGERLFSTEKQDAIDRLAGAWNGNWTILTLDEIKRQERLANQFDQLGDEAAEAVEN